MPRHNPVGPVKNCPICGAEFQATTNNRTKSVCSRACVKINFERTQRLFGKAR